MSNVAMGMNSGPRLEFVVRRLKGTVKRRKAVFEKKSRKIKYALVEEAAGYMVYLPNGNAYRLSDKELRRRGYDREPNILNFEKINDKNTPAGMFKFGRTEALREKGWRLMEDQIIRNCRRNVGPMIVSDHLPVPEDEDAVKPLYEYDIGEGIEGVGESVAFASNKGKELSDANAKA